MTCSRRLLQTIFENDLHFTPTPRQIDKFLADLRVVSPSLMHASLKEVEAARKLAGVPSREARRVIFECYHRKLAEHARMFPVFHVFENAMRSVLAHALEDAYVGDGGHPIWWRTIADWLDGSERPSLRHLPSGKTIKADALSATCHLLSSIRRRHEARLALEVVTDSYGLLALADMRHTQTLIAHHWGDFTRYFETSRPGAPPIQRQTFLDMFDKVRRTRNAVYHHVSMGSLNKTVDLAERLLDRLDVSLSHVCDHVAAATVAPLPLRLPAAARHVAFGR